VSSLTQLRGRIVAIAGVIALLLVAGVWIALTHASAQPTASTQHKPKPAAVAPLQLVSVTPASHSTGVSGTASIECHFSAPVAADSPMPTVKPDVAGSWQGAGTNLLQFVPKTGFRQHTRVTVTIPGGRQGVESAKGGLLASTVTVGYRTGSYTVARLDQLLAKLGYLPLTWTPAAGATVPADSDAAGQLSAAYSPPAGQFSWKPGYPSELRQFWQSGSPSGLIIQGAVRAFEYQHGLAMDGIPGPLVWGALLKAVAADQVNQNGYTYAIASEADPETLTVWHDGKVVLHTLANTGIPQSPTALGTYPVYLRYHFQIMRGKNPDGSKYADPVWFVSYFNGSDAVHYYPRASYGFPQSLGCVELPWDSAEQAWPYLTYGSLVTVKPGALTPTTTPGYSA
jgi:peptidoglycan hydrolase-like protein with peptidoglycan-binding domain